MLLSLFKTQPFLDESTTHWIIDTYEWALTQFDGKEFINNTKLILPTGEFFPARVSSIEEMAQTVFDKSLEYAGMSKWPIKLVSPAIYQQNPQLQTMPQLHFENAVRGSEVSVTSTDFSPNAVNTVYVSFNPNQINQPQDLVASFGQSFAAILIAQRGVAPPGGEEFMPQAIDLVACFLGFGVMFSNTAYQFKGGCGSCYNKYANREVALPENETLYCLAMFCVLKKIPINHVKSHLKSHLRSDFKKAYKELESKSKAQGLPLLSVN